MTAESNTKTVEAQASDGLVVEPRAVPFELDDPALPKVGKWYWLTTTVSKHVGWEKKLDESDDDVEITEEVIGKEFVCVVHIGSNYVELQGLDRGRRDYPDQPTWRVHFDDFHTQTEWIENPQAIIDGSTKLHQNNVVGLMQEIREVTARLAITPGLGLPGGPTGQPEAQSLGLVLAKGKPATEYKTSLVKAQKETLPELFKRIELEHLEMARWMGAPLIPLKANAEGMRPAIEAIEDRLFSVELYAGLCEEVEKIKDGEPAKLQEKVRIFQRRAYMDEECLAEYKTGGMTFRDLEGFDKWLCKPAQLQRLMPFPRCVLSFKVRRNTKQREFDGTLAAYFRIEKEEALDKLTFLYIRNGGRMYRLNTTIDFDVQLFPDMRREEPNGKLFAIDGGGAQWILKGENELRAMREDYETRHRQWKQKIKSVPKDERWRSENREPVDASERYRPFDQTNVYYDDISKYIAAEMTKHNRLVLVLQGILDRSEALHPHPPWSLWRQDSFSTALELIYDDDRVLVGGDKPDFEAYWRGINTSIKVGSIVIGQQKLWAAEEAKKENHKHRFNDHYRDRTYYYPRNNPGPGEFAHVVAIRGGKCYFQWNRSRRAAYGKDNGDVGVKFSVKTEKLFHIEGYKPGDFKKFFADPRTRAEYLKWAPLLLEAEEFHAGNREVAQVVPLAPRKERAPGGSFKYQKRKARLGWLGKAIRLVHDVSMKHGNAINKKGTLWRVHSLCRGRGFYVIRIDKEGKRLRFKEGDTSKGTETIRGLDTYDFKEAPEIPPEPKEKK
jgi:hypothetical protein